MKKIADVNSITNATEETKEEKRLPEATPSSLAPKSSSAVAASKSSSSTSSTFSFLKAKRVIRNKVIIIIIIIAIIITIITITMKVTPIKVKSNDDFFATDMTPKTHHDTFDFATIRKARVVPSSVIDNDDTISFDGIVPNKISSNDNSDIKSVSININNTSTPTPTSLPNATPVITDTSAITLTPASTIKATSSPSKRWPTFFSPSKDKIKVKPVSGGVKDDEEDSFF